MTPDQPDVGGTPPSRPRPDRVEPTPARKQVGAAAAVDDEPDHDWTADTIRAEHQATMASFTPIQARALARINRAFRESRMSNRSARDAMQDIYGKEAEERNAERAGRTLAAGAQPKDDTDTGDGL